MEIYSLTLVDRQRFPSADHVEAKNHLCYWRLDLPSLGSEHNCPLCWARQRVGDLADDLANPDYRKRVESWRDSWQPLNPATQWGDGGLRPIPLWLDKPERKFSIEPDPDKPGSYQQIGGDEQQIRITNSAGLAAYVSELHSITSHDDLSLRILNKELLSPEARIQLLTSQILLFSGEFDRDLAHDLGDALMKALWDAESHDRHTALAVLTLVGCGGAFLKKVIVRFFAEESHRKVAVNRNIDVILLLSLVLLLEKATARLDPNLMWLSELDAIWGLLKPRNKTELYGWLHRVVRDCSGKHHSTPLHRLKNAAENLEVLTPEFFKKILPSVRQLYSILDGVPRYWLRIDCDGHREYEIIQREVKTSSEIIVEKLAQLSNDSDKMKINRTSALTEARELANNLLSKAEKLHDGVFSPLGISLLKSEIDDSEPLLLEKLRELLTEWDGKKIMWYKPSPCDRKKQLAALNKPGMFEVYVLWDAGLVEAIQDILTNVRHAEADSLNPWDASDTERAHLWGRLELEERAVSIELCNVANNPKEESEKFNKTLSFRRAHLADSGCILKCTPYREDKVLTSISIPYAHTLRSTTEESKNG